MQSLSSVLNPCGTESQALVGCVFYWFRWGGGGGVLTFRGSFEEKFLFCYVLWQYLIGIGEWVLGEVWRRWLLDGCDPF